MPKAIWNNAVIAQSDRCEIVEGNTYFPPESLEMRYFRSSNLHTYCGWKGEASYYTVNVDGVDNANGAWYYPTPKPEAAHIAGYVAFWHGVEVVD